MEEYSPEQFAKLCVSLGYIPKLKIARKYTETVGKTVFTTIDLEMASRWFDQDSRVRRGDAVMASVIERKC